MRMILLIALGGALGAVARYGTGTLLMPAMQRSGFPWATLAVNLAGCFAIGYLNGPLSERWLVHPEYRMAVLVGLLGGYTTFSTFGWETMAMLRDAQWARAAGNILANNVLGIALVLAGYAASRGRW